MNAPIPWTPFFLQMAFLSAQRASCDRRHVGAVLVQDKRVISTGYNGAPPGEPHCDDVGHLMADKEGRPSCIRTVHAEMNALLFAAQYGISTRGSTMYVTDQPCKECLKAMLSAGVVAVFYARKYPGSDDQWSSPKLHVEHHPVSLENMRSIDIDAATFPQGTPPHEPFGHPVGDRPAAGSAFPPGPGCGNPAYPTKRSDRDIHQGRSRVGLRGSYQARPASDDDLLALAVTRLEWAHDDLPTSGLIGLCHPAIIAQALIIRARTTGATGRLGSETPGPGA